MILLEEKVLDDPLWIFTFNPAPLALSIQKHGLLGIQWQLNKRDQNERKKYIQIEFHT